MARNSIDEARLYSLGEIVRENLLPGVDKIAKATRLVMRDRMGDNLLKAKVEPMGKLIRYKIKGSNIINYKNEQRKKRD